MLKEKLKMKNSKFKSEFYVHGGMQSWVSWHKIA